jgi:sulfonate transport system substrate-binding protein
MLRARRWLGLRRRTLVLRRGLLALALVSALGCKADAPGASQGSGSHSTVRIGYQKSSVLVLAKWRNTIEPALKARGAEVTWAEFPAGPVLLEALNAGQLDVGYAGESPPIFAQAASPDMVYVAVEDPSPENEAILVPKGSAVATLADLKGKTVALNKGSNVHYFLVRALEKAGLSYSDVKVAFLAPADARAAFENGTVDAWAIWDPYYAAAEVALEARVLSTAKDIVPNSSFYLARRQFAEENAELLKVVLEQARLTDEWAQGHRDEVARYLGPLLGLDERAIGKSVERTSWGIGPITDATIESQQRIADTFHQLGLLVSPLRVADALPKTRPL